MEAFFRGLLLSAALPLTAYAQPTTPLKNPFVLEDIQFIHNPGTATVTGAAVIQLEDGRQKSCAGFSVELLPSAAYADERIFNTYRNNELGQILLSQLPPRFDPDDKRYHDNVLKTECNSDGRFVFNAVAAGTYYVIAFIIWPENDTQKGGAAMRKITVAPNDNIDINVSSIPLEKH